MWTMLIFTTYSVIRKLAYCHRFLCVLKTCHGVIIQLNFGLYFSSRHMLHEDNLSEWMQISFKIQHYGNMLRSVAFEKHHVDDFN